MTYTILCFVYRNPGISFSSFQNYYDNIMMDKVRSVVGEHFPLTHTRRYIHRGEDGKPTVIVGSQDRVGYDCISELVFRDEEHFAAFATAASTPEGSKIIRDAEKEFMDKEKMYVVIMGEEVVTRG